MSTIDNSTRARTVRPWAEIAEILKAYRGGATLAQLADEYGCHPGSISNLVHRYGAQRQKADGPRPKPLSIEEIRAKLAGREA